MNTEIKEIALIDQLKTALELVSRSNAIKIIKTVQEYESARNDYKTLIQYEKELDDKYNALECVIQAKQAQAQRKDLAAQFDTAKKYLKNTPMLVYERAEEAKRQAEERRLQAEAKKLADAETARQVAEQKRQFEIAEKAKKQAEEAQRKAQEAILAAQKKGNEAAAEKARQKVAEAAAEAQAQRDRAEQARQEALAIKQDAAQAVVPVVVVERTAPSVTRRMVPKWRYTDAAKVPCVYHKNDEVKISGVVRSMRANHGIEGIEYYEEPA